MRICQFLWRDRRGATALEFGMVGSTFVALILFLTGAGLLVWTKSAMQNVAMRTARCKAIGSSDCPNTQNYVVAQLRVWGVASFVPNVAAVATAGGQCGNAVGTFTQVTIDGGNGGIQATLMSPLSKVRLTAVACFPSGA